MAREELLLPSLCDSGKCPRGIVKKKKINKLVIQQAQLQLFNMVQLKCHISGDVFPDLLLLLFHGALCAPGVRCLDYWDGIDHLLIGNVW